MGKRKPSYSKVKRTFVANQHTKRIVDVTRDAPPEEEDVFPELSCSAKKLKKSKTKTVQEQFISLSHYIWNDFEIFKNILRYWPVALITKVLLTLKTYFKIKWAGQTNIYSGVITGIGKRLYLLQSKLTLCVREPAIDGMTRSKYHNPFKQLHAFLFIRMVFFSFQHGYS